MLPREIKRKIKKKKSFCVQHLNDRLGGRRIGLQVLTSARPWKALEAWWSCNVHHLIQSAFRPSLHSWLNVWKALIIAIFLLFQRFHHHITTEAWDFRQINILATLMLCLADASLAPRILIETSKQTMKTEYKVIKPTEHSHHFSALFNQRNFVVVLCRGNCCTRPACRDRRNWKLMTRRN